MANKERIVWDYDGRAKARFHHSKSCELCKGAKRTDEYGSLRLCYKCQCYGGDGTMRWTTYEPRPQYDAPRP